VKYEPNLGRCVYQAGTALLDLDNPSKVIARSKFPILEPKEDYEIKGDVPHVAFPTGAVRKEDQLYVYYGAADKTIGLAACELKALMHFLYTH